MPTQRFGTTYLRDLWCHYQCQGSKFTGCPPAYDWAEPKFYGKSIGGVPTVAVDAYAALERALKTTNYKAESVWAYNCRAIASSGKPSLHSFGIAIDIDPSQNPQANVPPYSGKFTEKQVDAAMGIKTVEGQSVWWWGGFWGGVTLPDLMHWQLDCTPSEALRIDWSTVPGGYEEGDDLANMSNDAQEYFQAIYESLKTDVEKPNQGDKNPPGPKLFSYLASQWRWSVKKVGNPNPEQIVARFMKDK
jgi:hypothetical protein